MSATTIERFCEYIEHQRFHDLAGLYGEDATFDLHIGDVHLQLKGADAIVARYTEDFHPAPTFLRWEGRPAPWGGVVEGDAVQGRGAARARLRWAHVLTIEDGRIAGDTVYCTGAVPYSG